MIALIDSRTGKNICDALREYGFTTVLMQPSPNLQDPIASHADMLLFIGFDRLFCHSDYYKSNKELIDQILLAGGLSLTLSDESWSKEYPNDVLFNAALVGDHLVCNKKTVSKDILFKAIEQGYKIVNIPQGYTKCSICTVSDNAVITADKAIEKACKSENIDVLLISEGCVSLPPYNFGFIGGASGTCGDKVYFCGSVTAHPDGDKIKNFCQKHGKMAVSLSDEQLKDVGSIFFVGE